jgi:hypothetical protein
VRYYAGIGSRQTPKDILTLMTDIANQMEQKGYVLRSGGAAGADLAFEAGVKDPNLKEIFLPNDPICKEAFSIAESIHPNWGVCNFGAKRCHARNVYQVLGRSLDQPSYVVICWTPGGRAAGGTRTAIMLARKHHIPIFNLAVKEQREKAVQFVASLESVVV